jgi:hypothetical protein
VLFLALAGRGGDGSEVSTTEGQGADRQFSAGARTQCRQSRQSLLTPERPQPTWQRRASETPEPSSGHASGPDRHLRWHTAAPIGTTVNPYLSLSGVTR